MSANSHRHLRAAADAAAAADRRDDPDRRLGIDRRGVDEPSPPSPEARPYGFREFGERRNSQDRRLYGIESGGFSQAERGADPGAEPAADADADADEAVEPGPFGIVPLSDGELRALLRRTEH